MKKSIAVAVLLAVSLLTACGGSTVPVNASVSESASSSFVASSPLSTNSVSSSSADSIVSSTNSQTNTSSAQTSSSASESSEPVSDTALSYKACALYCVDDNELMVGENVDDKIAPASLTKLMTASVALRYFKADDVITVGSELSMVQPDSSLAMIAAGQKLKMYDLLTGLLLPSGNDAAYTIAVSTARKASGRESMTDEHAVEYFCDLMNDLARELGMDSTHFADPDGWDDDAHYTTVSDLVKIAKYALTVPEIREIVAIPEKTVTFETGEVANWTNGNVFLHPEWEEYYRCEVIGMKTGSTDNAGYCLITAFVKNQKTYITVVVGSESWEDRNDKTLQLIDSVIG